MVGGVETSREGGATQKSDKVEFEEFIVIRDGAGNMPRRRNMSIHMKPTSYFLYQYDDWIVKVIFAHIIKQYVGGKTGSERNHLAN